MKCPKCNHTMKHHKQRGRCRKGCDCKQAQLKVERKERGR